MRMSRAIVSDNGSAPVVSLQDELNAPSEQRVSMQVKDLPSEKALKVAGLSHRFSRA